MKIKLLLCFFLLFSVVAIKAQFYVGGQVGVTYPISLKPMPTIGVHTRFVIKEQVFQVGFNYHLPFTTTDYDYANSMSGNNQLTINYSQKISLFDLHVHYCLYFGDASIEDGGFYGLAGLAMGVAHSKITILTPYDPTDYYLSDYFNPLSQYIPQPYLVLGCGFDKVLDNSHIIGAQLVINLNSSSYNSRTGPAEDVNLPSLVGLRITYTLPLGN